MESWERYLRPEKLLVLLAGIGAIATSAAANWQFGKLGRMRPLNSPKFVADFKAAYTSAK
jgi:hypothetical protein